MKWGLGLLFVLAAGVLRPLAAPAVDDPGRAANVFAYVSLEVTGATSASVVCTADFNDPAHPLFLFRYSYEAVDGWHEELFPFPNQHVGASVPPGPPVDAAVTVQGTHVDYDLPVVDAVWLATNSLRISFDPSRVRRAAVAAAIWSAAAASGRDDDFLGPFGCQAERNGEPVPMIQLDTSSARTYYPGDFDGTLTASVKSGAAASVGGFHEHEVTGELSGLFLKSFVGYSELRTTAPDGTSSAGQQVIYDGAPGAWRFDLTTVGAAEYLPSLWLLDLPVDWDAPAA